MRGHRRAHFWSTLTVLLMTATGHIALAQAAAGDAQPSAVGGPTLFGVPVGALLTWFAWRKRTDIVRAGKGLFERLGSLISARFRGAANAAPPISSAPASAHQLGDEEIGATVVVRRPSLGTIFCVSGVLLGQRWDVPLEGLSIGRDPDSDIVVRDPRVSARHAHIGPKEGRVVVADDGSTNGVFLNESSKRLAGEVVLERGDLVRLSETDAAQFIYRT